VLCAKMPNSYSIGPAEADAGRSPGPPLREFQGGDLEGELVRFTAVAGDRGDQGAEPES